MNAALPPLHILLPQIQSAVKARVDADVLLGRDPRELRNLIYDIVRMHEIEMENPALYLSRLGDKASADFDAVTQARDLSRDVRRGILDCLLETLRPALGSLLGPIVIDAWQRPHASNMVEQNDPHLRGFELVNGVKRGQVGPSRYERSGESLWIVALAPVEIALEVDFDPRYAIIEHRGEESKTDDGVETHAFNIVHLVTAEVAADKIRDDKLEAMMDSVVKRLRAAGSGKQEDLAIRIERAVRRLDHGLRALREWNESA